MNYFEKHKQKILGEQVARQAAEQGREVAGSNIYEQMLAQLTAHKVELKAVQSVKLKAEKKAEFIPEYLAYVDGVLAADEAVQDDVVVTILVWALDAGDFDLALRIAEWALKHDLAAPPNFTRTLATVLVEETADIALMDKDIAAEFRDDLNHVVHLTKGHDMPDPVRAKLFKATGYAQMDEFPQGALDHFEAALDLDPKIGVKTDIKALKKRIKGLTPATVPAQDETAQDHPPDASSNSGGADGATKNVDTIKSAENPPS
jgi:tetratricopeptide (TPR) repeat protein